MATETDNGTYIESFCHKARNPDRMVRQRALKDFEGSFIANASSAECVKVFDETYLDILRCYSDRFESVRILAVNVIDTLLTKLPANEYYLGYIVPVLAKRIGQSEIIEDSEELRLQLLEQLTRLVEKYADGDGQHGDPLLKVFDDIVDILIKTIRDPFPAAQKQSCEIVLTLADATPSLHYRAEALVAPTKSVLSHRHAANRIAAVNALGELALHIHSNGDRVAEIIMAISPLLMDDVPFVRRACGRAGCLMLLKLRDRYSFFHRIVPLVLSCLTDLTSEVLDDIKTRWEAVGELYYRENETELAKMALIDQIPSSYPIERYARPTLPCRAIVQRSLRLVNLVLHEMQEWKEDIRLHATKLLKQIVLHAECAFSTLFLEVNPVLAKTCMDAEQSVVTEALDICRLMGILLEYETWSKHVLVEFKKFPSIGQLRCIRTLYAHTVEEEAKRKDIKKFVAVLIDSNVCHNQDEKYQQELLKFCSILAADGKSRELSATLEEITVSDSNMIQHQSFERMLYTVVLKVIAFCDGEKRYLRGAGLDVLLQLDNDIDKLHEHHLASVLGSIDHLESENSDGSTNILLLCGIVSVCGFQESYFEIIRQTLAKALTNASPEGKVKLFSAISVAMLTWEEKNKQSNETQLALLKPFVDELISPYLVWSAGRSAESIRAMATACFASMAQGVTTNVYTPLLINYLNVLAGLIDDNNIATRAYTLKALVRLNDRLDIELLKLITFPILSRLDDPSSEVRELAATCLGRLRLGDSSTAFDSSVSDDSTLQRWQEMLKQILPVMFLHLENPEIKLRKAIVGSLQRLYLDNQDLVKSLAHVSNVSEHNFTC